MVSKMLAVICKGSEHFKTFLIVSYTIFLYIFLSCFEITQWMCAKKKEMINSHLWKKVHILLLLCLNLSSSPWPTGGNPYKCNIKLSATWPLTIFSIVFPIYMLLNYSEIEEIFWILHSVSIILSLDSLSLSLKVFYTYLTCL